MVYKNNCQGFIFVMTLSQQIQILYHYFIQELSYETQLETFIFEVAIHAVEHVRVITNICSTF